MASMELEEPPSQEEEEEEQPKSSHKRKKRKHLDSEQRASSKKRKHLNDAPDTPIPSSSKKKSKKPPKTTIPSSPSRDASPHHDISLPDASQPINGDSSPTTTASPFHLTTASLYLPLPAIALNPSTALPSLLTTHLTPLLLTYFPPLRGIILAISNPILSSEKPDPKSPPQPPLTSNNNNTTSSRTVLAHCADDSGLSYIWLTATYLLFRPSMGDELEGWVNVCSEGFVGLVLYNYFQVAVARGRIPARWRWVPPGGDIDDQEKRKMRRIKKKKKGKGRQRDGVDGEDAEASQETLVGDGLDGQVDGEEEEGVDGDDDGEEERENGYFLCEDGTKVTGMIKFRVVDCEIVPGHDRESWSLQIEGTLLSREEQEKVLEEERQRALRKEGKAVMSGGLRASGNGTRTMNQSRGSTPI